MQKKPPSSQQPSPQPASAPASPAGELTELEAEAAQFDAGPAAAPADEPAPPAKRDFTLAARGLVETCAVLARGFVGVTYDEPTKAEVTAALAPVLAKYDGQMPPWLAKYQEEINLLVVLAGVGLRTYNELQARAASKPATPAPAQAPVAPAGV